MDAKRGAESTEELLAMAAHDLRAPLRQIALQLALFQRRHGAELSDPAQAEFTSMQQQARNLQNLLEDMLQWVSGAPREAATPVLLADALASVRAMLGGVLEAREATLIDADLGPLAVLARPRSVERLLLNLVRNALEHGPSGVRVEVSATPVDNDWVRMAVRDNGPGIPAQWHEKIFEPFRQGSGHQASGGSGLGLAICKRLARDEHGELGLCTPPEGGAEFWVLLPRAATTAGDP